LLAGITKYNHSVVHQVTKIPPPPKILAGCGPAGGPRWLWLCNYSQNVWLDKLR